VVATRAVAETPGEEGWGLLRQMCTDVVKLRRADLQAERLALERDRTVLRANIRIREACGQARQEQPKSRTIGTSGAMSKGCCGRTGRKPGAHLLWEETPEDRETL